MYRWMVVLSLGFCLMAAMVVAQAANDRPQSGSTLPHGSEGLAAANSLSSSSITFTKNEGQWPDSILYRASSGRTAIWFTRDGIYCEFFGYARQSGTPSSIPAELPDSFRDKHGNIETAIVKAEFVGANKNVEVTGLEETSYRCNYFLGNDPNRWRTNVPNYTAILFKNIYPGVDISFRGRDGRLEYQQTAASNRELGQVAVGYRGGEAAVKRSDGTVSIQTQLGEKVFMGAMPASLDSATLPQTSIAALSPSNVTLIYSTYLGGNTPDVASGIAVDTAGCAYVTGWTYSADFPKRNPLDNTLGGIDDIFVTKLTASGNGLVYSTFLGGSSEDDAWGIAVDKSGNAYVAGQTSSVDFPSVHSYDNALGGDWDVFVAKLSATGNAISYSTYLGGSSADLAFGIAVDATGRACVTGTTRSSDFPSMNSYDNTLGGSIDGFVTKLAANGSSLVFSTFLGGDGADSSYAICVNELGDTYVTGSTNSGNFPVQDGVQATLAGGSDVFVTKLASAGTSLDYSTFIGGSSDDIGYAIAYGGSDSVYVTGRTNSTNFPTYAAKGHPYQTTFQGGTDAFVTELVHTSATPSRTSLVYSSYLGGGLVDRGLGIAKQSNNIFVTGYTYSTNFPIREAFQTYQSGPDVFVTKLCPDSTNLIYSTYIGGNGTDWGFGIALDRGGYAYVGGYTSSTNFPTRTPYQGDQGSYDAFVAKLSATTACCQGTRGNVNITGIIDLTDLSLLIAYLTATPRPTLLCPDAANINGTGIIDLIDLSLLIAYLTVTPRPTLPNCP